MDEPGDGDREGDDPGGVWEMPTIPASTGKPAVPESANRMIPLYASGIQPCLCERNVGHLAFLLNGDRMIFR